VALPPAPPCSDLLRGLPFGQELTERSEAVASLPRGDHGPLTELFPSLRQQGFLVEKVLGIQIEQDTSARLLVLHRPLPEGASPLEAQPTWLGLASCTKDRGYALLSPPVPTHDSSATLVWDTERVTLPGGKEATLVTVAIGGVALEFHAAAFLLGQGGGPFPVQDPRGASHGALGVFGNVAQQFLIPGQGESYARADRAQGTGFYPLGERRAFVSLQVERQQLRGVVQGWIGPRGVEQKAGLTEPAWAAVGKGPLPSFCDRGEIRCARLSIPESQGALEVSWIAGLWPGAEAAGASLKALGADLKQLDFLLIGAETDRDPPRGPGGKRALTFLKAKAPPRQPRR
jgi:hypothetical protein